LQAILFLFIFVVRNLGSHTVPPISSLLEIRRVLKPGGVLTLVYAHKTVAGWERLVEALRKTDFIVTQAWPLRDGNGEPFCPDGRRNLSVWPPNIVGMIKPQRWRINLATAVPYQRKIFVRILKDFEALAVGRYLVKLGREYITRGTTFGEAALLREAEAYGCCCRRYLESQALSEHDVRAGSYTHGMVGRQGKCLNLPRVLRLPGSDRLVEWRGPI
jgi:SAM-dependent methyltransferase